MDVSLLFLNSLIGYSCLLVIALSQGVLSESTTPALANDTTSSPSKVDIRGLCAATTCVVRSQCRVVFPCDNCLPTSLCTDRSSLQPPNIDDVCRSQNYLQSLLVSSPQSDSDFKLLTCNSSCPIGSVCIIDDEGDGRCCTGKPTENPGFCPESIIGVCGGEPCLFDNDCSGGKKCCNSGCGPLCTEPLPDLGCGQCDEGQTCVLRQPECPPGLSCTQAFLPTCVPDACANCETNQECRQERNICDSGEDCPEFNYFCGLKGTDECGKFAPCQDGFTCGTGVICAGDFPGTSPTTVMTAATVPASPSKARSIIISDPFCAEVKICLPSTNKDGVCPALPPLHGAFGVCGGIMCSEDSDCPDKDKCCESVCGGQLCKTPEPDLGCGQCPFGEVCIQKSNFCPVGVICEVPEPECVPRDCVNCTDFQECRRIKSSACAQDIFCPEFTYFCGLKTDLECDATRPCPRGERCSKAVICESPTPGTTQDTATGRREEDVESPTSGRSTVFVTPQTTPSGRREGGVLLDPFCADVSNCLPDKCGGCPEGQECKDSECVKIDECGGCRQGLVCRVIKYKSVYKCVPEPPSCLKRPKGDFAAFLCYFRWFRQPCLNDSQCGFDERCCLDECGKKTCLRTRLSKFIHRLGTFS